MISSNSMLQTNVREGYKIITLEVIKLIEDLISYLQNAQIPKVFYKAAYSAKVKIEDLSNTLTLILSKIAQRQSLSVVSNRSIALITNKFSVALLTKLAILNNANIALVDAVHYSQKLEENYFKVIDALIITLIKDNDDLLGTVNSYIKPPLKRYKTEAADSRYAKVSRGRTKKDKDLENSNTSSDVLRLRRRDRAAASQLKKTRDEEKLAKAKKEKEEKELIDAYILYFKELLSNNSRIFANAIGIGKMRAIVLAVLIRHFCFFSDSLLENIGRLIKEEVIEMRINTTNAISKALAAANKLFIIVCSFRKVDKHMFKAYNTISVTAQRIIIRKGSPYIEKRAILLSNILEKEGLNKLEASRRVIFNCFKMQAIISYSALTTLKAAYVKDLFTNLSKDYFLVREARAITKSSLKFQNLLNLCSKLAEMCVGIVYFNLDSKLELKVLSKQDVKTTF
ncbi:hypothetical protein HBI51_048460 [Parastagonospora nodorum]|nr:hypothetical protein HBI51_048460 [Parastagonospora nodorum]